MPGLTQRSRPHGGGGGHGDRGLQPCLAATGQSLDAAERRTGVRAAATAVLRAATAVRPAGAAPRLLLPRHRIRSSSCKKLAELKNQGILTDAEFQAQKAKILSS